MVRLGAFWRFFKGRKHGQKHRNKDFMVQSLNAAYKSSAKIIQKLTVRPGSGRTSLPVYATAPDSGIVKPSSRDIA